jgi:hypothetical protein
MQKLKVEKNVQPHQQAQKAQVNEDLSGQMGYLQRTMGNKKVQELIQLGALPANIPDAKISDMKNTQDKRTRFEKDQIDKDKTALKPEIEKIIQGKKSTLESIKKANPGKPVYANVNIDLVYVNIPAEKSERLYHYTKLNDVSLSLDNISRDLGKKQSTRGESAGIIFSFLYDENKAPEVKGTDETAKTENSVEAENTSDETTAEENTIKEKAEKILKKELTEIK